jgi:hypothetical protein
VGEEVAEEDDDVENGAGAVRRGEREDETGASDDD